MARDPEMVKRASDAHLTWWQGPRGMVLTEMMADFASDEVERQAKWLRGQLSEAVAQRDDALASRSKAEDLVIAARKAEAEQRSRAITAEAQASKAEYERDARVSRADFDILAQLRCDAVDRALKAEAAHRATLDLYAKADARADRAEARVRELEAKHPAPLYTPRVGDVVAFWGGCVGTIAHKNEPDLGWHVVGRGGSWWDVWFDHDLRPATPAERYAAGLPTESPEPAEAPAAPRVLPEHLAWIEADAAWADSSWSTDFDLTENRKRHDAAIVAAKALNAAVARRDGGAK